MTERTTTLTIGGKSYTLSPMTIAEYKKARKLSEQLKQLLRHGNVTEQIADDFQNEVLAIIRASIERSGESVTLEAMESAMTHQAAVNAFAKLVEISTAEIGPETFGGLIQ
jgi:hypothetical protein